MIYKVHHFFGGPCISCWSVRRLLLLLIHICVLRLVTSRAASYPSNAFESQRESTLEHHCSPVERAQDGKILSTAPTAAIRGSFLLRSVGLAALPPAYTRRALPSLTQTTPLHHLRGIQCTSTPASAFSRLVSLLLRNHPRLSKRQAIKAASATATTTKKMSNTIEKAMSPIPPPPATVKLDASKGPLVWIDCEYVRLLLRDSSA